MTSSSCPLCGLTGCAAPRAQVEVVAPDVVARVRRAVGAGVPAPSSVAAHPLRVRWTIRADEWATADLPPGTVYVGHGAGWSNPFDRQNLPHDEAVARYREWLLARPRLVARARRELAGRHLACWCSLTVTCHADVLLELVHAANARGGVPSAIRTPVGPTPAR